jgi:hypothetical protein
MIETVRLMSAVFLFVQPSENQQAKGAPRFISDFVFASTFGLTCR